jgi:hypothetical protein
MDGGLEVGASPLGRSRSTSRHVPATGAAARLRYPGYDRCRNPRLYLRPARSGLLFGVGLSGRSMLGAGELGRQACGACLLWHHRDRDGLTLPMSSAEQMVTPGPAFAMGACPNQKSFSSTLEGRSSRS